LILLVGCATPEQKHKERMASLDASKARATNTDEMLAASRTVIVCDSCQGLSVTLAADQDVVAYVAETLDETIESWSRTMREIGGKVADGLFSPTTALMGLGMYGIDKAGNKNNNSVNDSNNTASASSNSRSSSTTRSTSTNTVQSDVLNDKSQRTETATDQVDNSNQNNGDSLSGF